LPFRRGEAAKRACHGDFLASAAHLKCCCAPRIAGTPLEWRPPRLIVCCSFRKEECRSMRVYVDRKRLDGNTIAFVVIALLIVIAFAY
jgi:hypothetical protein